MIATIHQPEYLPCLPLLGKIAQADTLVLLDDVQFKRDSLQQRAWVAAPNGHARWITIPFVHRHPQSIGDVEIANRSWQRSHSGVLKQLYGTAPHFDRLDALAPLWSSIEGHLWAPVSMSMHFLSDAFDISRSTFSSSSLSIQTDEPSERLAEICHRLEATTYLSGASGRKYLDLRPFDERGIEVVFNQCQPPHSYRGEGTPENVGRISGLDALLWHDDPRSLLPTELIR